MKRIWTLLFVLLVVASLTLTACGPKTEAPAAPATEEQSGGAEATEAPSDTEASGPQEVTLTIGYTASVTGKYNVSSGRQVNGLKLWMQQINDAGGIQLSDGTIVKFQDISYDDESSSDRVQELYTRLATEDNADLLISPYSSGLTSAAALIAEQYGKVMITTGAASDSTYKQGFTGIYQIYTPASRYLTGAVDLLKATDPAVTKVAFVYENSKFSTAVVTAAKDYAEQQGYEVVLFEGYDPETTDFSAFINKIEASGAEAILGGGHFQDGSTFARQIFERGLPVKFMTLLVAPPEPDFADLGDAAVGIIGPSQWEPLAAFQPDFGPTGKEFEETYVETYGEEPSYHSAGGYAAGLILQKAIMDADSTDPEAIKAALDAMDLTIFFGNIKFDTTPEAHGLQIGHSMIYIQWQRDADGNLVKQVVWPANGATADILYPLH